MTREVPRGIDAENVSRFLSEQVPGCSAPFAFELISGGRSNLTYLVRDAAGATLVLRRPPLGHVLPTAHDMAREFRVLRGLAGTDVPAPRPIALCEDPAVNEMAFYVMTHCPGVVPADGLPPGTFSARCGSSILSPSWAYNGWGAASESASGPVTSMVPLIRQ